MYGKMPTESISPTAHALPPGTSASGGMGMHGGRWPHARVRGGYAACAGAWWIQGRLAHVSFVNA